MIQDVKLMTVVAKGQINDYGDTEEIVEYIEFEAMDTKYNEQQGRKVIFFPRTAKQLFALEQVTYEHTEFSSKFGDWKDDFNGHIQTRKMLIDGNIAISFEIIFHNMEPYQWENDLAEFVEFHESRF